MIPSDYFKIADFLANLKHNLISEEICLRTAINRLYYGIFHLVRIELGIIIPKSKINRCHAFVKEKIEETDIRSDYTDLEQFRIEVDYVITNKITINQYYDALKIQKRIVNSLNEPEFLPYDEGDEDFFFNIKGKKK